MYTVTTRSYRGVTIIIAIQLFRQEAVFKVLFQLIAVCGLFKTIRLDIFILLYGFWRLFLILEQKIKQFYYFVRQIAGLRINIPKTRYIIFSLYHHNTILYNLVEFSKCQMNNPNLILHILRYHIFHTYQHNVKWIYLKPHNNSLSISIIFLFT